MNLTGERASLSRIGNYFITGRSLGRGSFAKVYEAIHRHLNTTVALKTVNVTDMKDSYMKQHFKREAALLARLNHPGVISLFEVMQTRNHYCIVLEFGGDNLCDFVHAQKRGRLDEVTARGISRQLVSAVSYIHESGVVHRDIKLENILVNKATKKVKLTDFGLSNAFDKKSLLTTHCGSPEYAAPELHLGQSYGFEVDIWASGVVLFAMVVGRLPFEIEMKKPVTNQQRRELFLVETKRGLKTMKHQTFMGSASFHFKDLVSKMLNPSREFRLKIEQVQKHPWIAGVFSEQFTPVNAKWKSETFQKYSKNFNLTIEEVSDEIIKQPFGQLGGIYNIEKHLHQVNRIALRKPPSCASIIKSAQSNNSSAFNRPPTSAVSGDFTPPVTIPRRPKTTQSKHDQLKKLDNNLLRQETRIGVAHQSPNLK